MVFFLNFTSSCVCAAPLPLLSISCEIQHSSHGLTGNGICVTGLNGSACDVAAEGSEYEAGGGGDRQFDCPPKWYEMKWEMEIVMAVAKRRRGLTGEWRFVTWHVIETDTVHSSNLESVISNLILWWINMINIRSCAQGDKASVGGVESPNWLIAEVYMFVNWRYSLWISVCRSQSKSITCLLQQPSTRKLKCRSGVGICVSSCWLKHCDPACACVCVWGKETQILLYTRWLQFPVLKYRNFKSSLICSNLLLWILDCGFN